MASSSQPPSAAVAAAAASAAAGNRLAAGPARPTTYYFAYGSNLHLRQMKRRCPESRYIGRARLVDHRWQINQRGYANVHAAQGHWVDGLVYEINTVDEAKLDINEGVSKNAYIKRRMDVHLHRAPSVLYRRPTSWIVDGGGPAKVQVRERQQARSASSPASASAARGKQADISHHWVQKVLVYISINHTQDSAPKAEYINRINLGILDARALGIDEDYITNCIRPFIPPPPPKTAPAAAQEQHLAVPGVRRAKTSSPRGQKRTVSPRSGDPSPARPGPARRPDRPKASSLSPVRDGPSTAARKRRVVPHEDGPPALPPRDGRPPLPPRPTPIIRRYSYHGEALVVVEDNLFSP